MNKRYIVRLNADERARLEALVSKGSAKARKIIHAQILQKVDEDGPRWTDEQTAEAFGVHTSTVRAVRERFVFEGLESALNRKKAIRPPTEPKLDGAQEARLVAIACSQPPDGRARWTLNLLAGRLVELKLVDSISYETVRRTLKKTR
jgi:transposase